MLTAVQIREEIANLDAEVQAIVNTATEEKRELTAEESTRINAIQGKDKEPGEIAALEARLDQRLKIENRQKVLAAELMGKQLGSAGRDDDLTAGFGDASTTKRIIIPSNQRPSGSLKAFKGETAEQDAFLSGHWIAATFYNSKTSKKWMEEFGIHNAMSESEDDRGGIFVPVEMKRAIIRLVESFGVIRRYASIEPMGSDRKVVPVRVAGLTATPVAETTRINEGSNTVTAQDIIWTNIELIARKWKIVCKWSDELNADALIALADKVAEEAALAFAYSEDNCAFNGDGTSTYHGITGILNAVAAGSLFTARTGNTAFSTLDREDFEDAAGQLPDFAGIDPTWFISKKGYYASMHRLQMAAGGNTVTDIANGGRPMFLGIPVQFTNVLNKTLTAQVNTKLCVLGDARMGTLFGDRNQMTMKLTDQRYWDEDQIAVKATERFDFNVHSIGTASEAGALVVMQTPGS